jgi:hypothetical protein
LQVLNGMPGLTKVQTGTRLKDGLRTWTLLEVTGACRQERRPK